MDLSINVVTTLSSRQLVTFWGVDSSRSESTGTLQVHLSIQPSTGLASQKFLDHTTVKRSPTTVKSRLSVFERIDNSEGRR